MTLSPQAATHSRRRRASLTTFLAAVLLIAPAALAQPSADEVDVVVTQVSGPVHMLVGYGGNIGISTGEDGVLIVDDQFAWLAEKIAAALEKLQPGKPRFILNTHWHYDHTGGNEAFGATGTIVAHSNVRERLMKGGSPGGREIPPAPAGALPVITFDESMSVHFNGEEIELIHVPNAHTDGDTAILFRASNVAHLGDLFFSGRFPFVDGASGGSVTGLIDAIAHLVERLPKDVRIIPGHGPLSTHDDLVTYLDMLRTTRSRILERAEKGASLDEIVAEGLPENWADWGSGFIDEKSWIAIVLSDGAGR